MKTDEQYQEELAEQIEDSWVEFLTPANICDALTDGIIYPFTHSMLTDGIARHNREVEFDADVHYPMIAELVVREDALTLGTLLLKQIEAYARKLAKQEIEK